VLLYLASFLFSKPLAAIFGGGVLALALVSLLSGRAAVVREPELKRYLAVLFLFYLLNVVSVWYHGDSASAGRFAIKEIHLLIGCAILLLGFSPRLLLRCLALFAAATFVVALMTIVQGWGFGISRPPTIMLSIQAGYLLVYGLLLMAAALSHASTRPVRYACLGALPFFLIALYLNGSRGAWLSALVALSAHVFLLASRVHWKKRLFVFLAVMLLLPSVPGVRERALQAWRDIDGYCVRNTYESSLGLRFEMWRASLEMFRSSPLLGVGRDSWQREIQKIVTDENLRRRLSKFNQPHNQYFFALATTGLVGGALLLAVALVPLCMALTRTTGFFRDALVMICVAFLVQGLSETLPTMYRVIQAYFSLSALLAAGVIAGAPRTGETSGTGSGVRPCGS
jgi:O-antigen ligase